MNTRTLLPLIALAALTGQAAAQPPPATDSVSQINGQLVKVGEHNEYSYDFKRWNVSTNPVGWILGSYGVSLSYGVSDNLALRADVNFWNQPDGDESGFEIGAGAPIYFRRTYSGAFLEPGFIVRNVKNDYDGSSETVFGPQVLVGWHWSWDSGLNIAAAVGVGRNWSTGSSNNSDEWEGSNEEAIFPNGYLRFGYEW